LDIYETRKIGDETVIRLIGLKKFIVDDLSEIMGSQNIRVIDLGNTDFAVEFVSSKFYTMEMERGIWICRADRKFSLVYIIYKYWYKHKQ